MKNLANFFIAFFSKIAIALIAYSSFRILFFLFNQKQLGNFELLSFLGGIRFDLFAVSYLLSPFILIFTFSFGQLKKLSKFLFLFPIVIASALEFIDLEYFKFTNKRTSFDLFTTDGLANDILNLLPSFIVDFWYIIILFVLFNFVLCKLYDLTPSVEFKKVKLIERLTIIPIVLALSVIASRGGVQLRPISFTDAGAYASANNIPLVLNTSYSILKSSYKEDLKDVNWLAEDEANELFSPIQVFERKDSSRKLNVVIIILESFGQEYIGAYNEQSIYTPFLDSIIDESLHFPNAYANGKKSIEALPAILSSIPNLMQSPYISSKYGSNKIQSVAKTLSKYGYKSSFYHGATTGTMGFNSFSNIAGIDQYYGKEDYPSEEDFDGKWGIFDEPYFDYFRKELNKKEEPFISILFSLSSHHPFTIPKHHQGKFPKGELPILESVAYTDYALSKFFNKAKNESWFNNTLFIITADHTSTSISPEYSNRTGIYKIPLLFYAPQYIRAQKSMRIVSQLDIYPTIIDFLGLGEEIYTFGRSVFSNESGYAINYLNNQYQFIQDDYAVLFDGTNSLYTPLNIADNSIDSIKSSKPKISATLKAIVQRYNHDLIHNKAYHE